jgi:RES domain
MTDLQGIRPPSRVTRVGRRPNPWAWPPWEAQHSDATFGNRWDDPEGIYRVLYAATQLEGAYVEVLSRFRPDPAVVAELAKIDGSSEAYQIGIVPSEWLEARAIGQATLTGVYADVGHARSLTYLRVAMAPRILHHDIGDLDAAAIRLSAPRRFTQEISNHIYLLSLPSGLPRFAGIEYESRLGDNYQNWAIFERPRQKAIANPRIRPIRRDDQSLHAALASLGLTLAD